MKRLYRESSEKQRAARLFLPEIELLERCRELVDRTVEEAGRIVVEALLGWGENWVARHSNPCKLREADSWGCVGKGNLVGLR